MMKAVQLVKHYKIIAWSQPKGTLKMINLIITVSALCKFKIRFFKHTVFNHLYSKGPIRKLSMQSAVYKSLNLEKKKIRRAFNPRRHQIIIEKLFIRYSLIDFV